MHNKKTELLAKKLVCYLHQKKKKKSSTYNNRLSFYQIHLDQYLYSSLSIVKISLS